MPSPPSGGLGGKTSTMTIAEFDHLDVEERKKLLYQCCGSTAWVNKMLAVPAAEDLVDLFEDAEECWYSLAEDDWKEAFGNHPRIGDLESLKKKFANDHFAEGEQSGVSSASEQTLNALADGNKAYEEKFGYIFIVSAEGKSAVELLGLLTARLQNKPQTEITIAVDEQNKITRLRLEKLFNS
jgi:2-oxo-4-hydroxy-4-carboxy-5-ureidoimidazoline decarboxylase